jgi:NhaA family Na+:H+ antiporter
MPETARPIKLITSPFARFAKIEAAGGILLVASTMAALLWANSPWEQSYYALWHTNISIGFGRFFVSESRHEWVNSGLMSLLFFLMGLEIKREALIGELSSFKQAAFPIVAAVGGTAVPALIYFAINRGTFAQRGWGIAMATDVAVALGVLALLGERVPVSLKVFVTALAIVDDIFATLEIAIFYTGEIDHRSLFEGLAGIGLSLLANRLGMRKPVVYGLIGFFVWCAVMRSGVHATVAGVLLAFTIPASTYLDKDHFLKHSRWILDRFESAGAHSSEEHAAIYTLEKQCELVAPPLERIEHQIAPWVGFLVMPMFAFANAGVHILGSGLAEKPHPVTLGVILGLLVGKPVGICLFAWLAAKTRLATPPPGVSWRQIAGASWLCGIGFTMSLFIATLAFDTGPLLDMTKIGILAGSLAAAICGWAILATNPQ